MIQTVDMTHEAKVKMYRKVSKDKLIEMLIEANRHLAELTSGKEFVKGIDHYVGIIRGNEKEEIEKRIEEYKDEDLAVLLKF